MEQQRKKTGATSETIFFIYLHPPVADARASHCPLLTCETSAAKTEKNRARHSMASNCRRIREGRGGERGGIECERASEKREKRDRKKARKKKKLLPLLPPPRTSHRLVAFKIPCALITYDFLRTSVRRRGVASVSRQTKKNKEKYAP